jgi:uncharacterized protein (TIGR02118 family)
VIKTIIFFRRRPGMSLAAFQEHWRTAHAALIVRLPGIRRYVQNHVLPPQAGGAEPAFDAVAESSFDDTQAMKTLAKSPEYAAVLADEPNFIDRATMGMIVTEEHVIKDGLVPPNAVKSIALLNRRSGTHIDEFLRCWREVHGPRVAALPGVCRYVQCHTRRSAYEGGRTPAFDGAAMTWVERMPVPCEAHEGFASPERSRQLLARERVVLAGPQLT